MISTDVSSFPVGSSASMIDGLFTNELLPHAVFVHLIIDSSDDPFGPKVLPASKLRHVLSFLILNTCIDHSSATLSNGGS
jgi:hypothetical protein